MLHTVSFTILDDLEPAYGPVHVSIDNLEPETIKAAVEQIATPFLKYLESAQNAEDSWMYQPKDDEAHDPSGWYFRKFPECYNPDDIVRNLVEDGYDVWNRFEKYYVIAWTIDYTRFEVFSRGYAKELIKWRENDANDAITGIINNPDYNENPVITLLKNLN